MTAKTKLDVWNIDYIDGDGWEEIPTEDLWEDGELDTQAVIFKMYSNVCRLGKWKLIRRKK